MGNLKNICATKLFFQTQPFDMITSTSHPCMLNP